MSLGIIKQKVRKAYLTGFFHIFGMNVLNKIIAFVSTAVLVRILSKTEYGVFTYSWNIYSIILLFNGLGVVSAILQLSSEHGGDEEYTRKISSYGILLGLRFDVLLVIIIIGIALFTPLKVEGAQRLLFLLSILPVVQLFYDASQVVLRAQKRNKEYAYLCLISTILIFVASVGGAIMFREVGMVIGYYFSYSVCSVYTRYVFDIKLIGAKDLPEDEEKKTLISIASVSMANNAISQLLYLLDVFVLGLITAEEELLAGYKVATLIPSALVFIPMSLVTYIYPFFAEHRNDKDWCLKRYRQVILGMGGVNFVLSSILYLGAKIIVQICFGKNYIDVVPIFRVLAINYFFSGTFRIIAGNLLVTQRKLKFNLFVAILCGLTNVVADYLFINWWGAIGAAYATLLIVVLSSVLNVSYLLYSFATIRGDR